VKIDTALVVRLVGGQFPQWANLPVTPVDPGGWDNRTFHLGAEMIVRLPSTAPYAAQVDKEQLWLPRLAPLLPCPIPVPVGIGEPAEGYPWRWSVYRWINGETAAVERIADLRQFAVALAGFLSALQRIDPTDGPPAGTHNFHRGGPLTTYDAETRRAIEALRGRIDADVATAIWETALGAPWRDPPVWLHGDVAAGNLLTHQGQLSGVIDFGCCGVGDPACDLAIAWTLFDGENREAFRAALPLDAAAWARGRGWALWKALIVLAAAPGANHREIETSRRAIDELLADRPRDRRT
jgi:aminoglycoside phosphotransferase (APT) family kinase protein